LLGDEVAVSPRKMCLLSAEVVGAGERKEDVVMNSMYAWVREAVVLRSGVRRRSVRQGGVMLRRDVAIFVVEVGEVD
jgi:hypothetical protein